MSTSSTVTTQIVSNRFNKKNKWVDMNLEVFCQKGTIASEYGEKAAEATNEGLGAAGLAIGTAWAALKIRKSLNPKSVLKPTTIAISAAKAAASEVKSKKSSE